MSRSRVIVAMSGGVDSSVAAALLKEQGYQVIGVTLRLFGISEGSERTCCASKDIVDARMVAERIGIPHYTLDYERSFFYNVVKPFAESYGRGETPVPCILCNKAIKFRGLLTVARILGAEGLATGHYVRRLDGVDGPELWRGRDSRRDQSYFLFNITRAQLSALHFPLGEMESKVETRVHAYRFGLHITDKQGSRDICFAPERNYAQVIHTIKPDVVQPGDIVHIDGRILGHHRGIVYYTVGQRRGLGVSGMHEPLYVIHLEPAKRQVIVGPRAALLRNQLTVNGINWIELSAVQQTTAGVAVSVRLRSMQTPLPATVYIRSNGIAQVLLTEPFDGIVPGQACVFYKGEQVLGGGWISRY